MKIQQIKNKLILLFLTFCCFALFTQTIYSQKSSLGRGRYAQHVITTTPKRDIVLEKVIEYTVDLNDISKANNAIKKVTVLLNQINEDRVDSFFDFIEKAWFNSTDPKIDKNLIYTLLQKALDQEQFFNETQQSNLNRFKFIIEDEIREAPEIKPVIEELKPVEPIIEKPEPQPEPEKFTLDEIKEKFGKLTATINKLTLDNPRLYRQTSRRAMASGLRLLKNDRTEKTKENAPTLLEFIYLVEIKKDHPDLMNTKKVTRNVTEILEFRVNLEKLVDKKTLEKLQKSFGIKPAKKPVITEPELIKPSVTEMPEFMEEIPLRPTPEIPTDLTPQEVFSKLEMIIYTLNKTNFIEKLKELKALTKDYLKPKAIRLVRSKFFEAFLKVNSRLNLVDFVNKKDQKEVYTITKEIFENAQNKLTLKVRKKKLGEWAKEIDEKLKEM